MICDVCHQKTNSGTKIRNLEVKEIDICPNCLMWSNDDKAKLAREIILNVKPKDRKKEGITYE